MTEADITVQLKQLGGELAEQVGHLACLYGFPLIETYRTCHLQTQAGGKGITLRACNRLDMARQPATHLKRGVVTQANDLLYSSGWTHLGRGPALLPAVPGGRRAATGAALLVGHHV